MKSSKNRFRILLLLVLTAAFAVSSPAHNYHTSLTRMDFNSEKKILEIEINLFNHDLEKVLGRANKTRIDLEKTNGIDRIILEYLEKNFVVKNKNAEILKLKWIGKELKVDQTTVFVEIEQIENLEGFTLLNTIFFESFSKQVNLIVLHSGENKAFLSFKVGDKSKELKN